MSAMNEWLQHIDPGPSFSDEMVRAVMEGRKTQTRRVINMPEANLDNERLVNLDGWEVECQDLNGETFASIYIRDPQSDDGAGEFVGDIKSPYQPGEIYYLREGIQKCCYHAAYTATGDAVKADTDIGVMMWEKANGEPYKVDKLPGIYMPRRAARTFLRIDEVRAERVQDISEADARAEGVKPIDVHIADDFTGAPMGRKPSFRYGFRKVWENIHSPGSWKANSWVWVLEFETVSREKARKGVQDD